MTDLLQKTVIVTGLKGDTYTFRMPTLFDEFRIAARMKEIRAKTDPTWNGTMDGLDDMAMWSMRACATFDMQLESASVRWCFSETKDGGPKIDSEKFAPDRIFEVHAVYRGYSDQVTRFRAEWLADEDTAGTEGVAGEPNSGDVPVQP
jgi:hypothetical protein